MEFSYRKSGDFCVIDIAGQVKVPDFADLQRKLLGVIESGEKNIVINCTGLTYISSTGLRILLVALKKVTAAGGTMRIAGLQDNIREIMVIAGFTSIFSIFTTLEEALTTT
jgi:anti-anti-sigma factor